MHQVVINMIRPESFKFFLKIVFRAGQTADQILWKFCRDIYLIPDPVPLQDSTQKGFAPGIDIGSVIIVYACPEGCHDLPFRLLLIDGASLPCKAHTAESQNRQFPTVPVPAVLHIDSLPIILTSIEINCAFLFSSIRHRAGKLLHANITIFTCRECSSPLFGQYEFTTDADGLRDGSVGNKPLHGVIYSYGQGTGRNA
jgi:hypothetical protein